MWRRWGGNASPLAGVGGRDNKETAMPTLRTTLAAVLATLTLAACETVEGAGQDIETLGESLQEESNEAQY